MEGNDNKQNSGNEKPQEGMIMIPGTIMDEFKRTPKPIIDLYTEQLPYFFTKKSRPLSLQEIMQIREAAEDSSLRALWAYDPNKDLYENYGQDGRFVGVRRAEGGDYEKCNALIKKLLKRIETGEEVRDHVQVPQNAAIMASFMPSVLEAKAKEEYKLSNSAQMGISRADYEAAKQEKLYHSIWGDN